MSLNENENTEIGNPQVQDSETNEVLNENQNDSLVAETTQEQNPDTKTEVDTGNVIKPPVRYEDESEIQHALRMQLFQATQQREQADTQEEKSLITQHIKQIRGEIAKVNSGKSESVSKTKEDPDYFTEEEETLLKENIKRLGYVSKDELSQMLSDLKESAKKEALEELHATKTVEDHKTATNNFYKQRPDIASNPVIRAQFEEQVIKLFGKNINQNTPAEDLQTYMDMTAQYLYPKKTDNRKINAESASEKRNIVDISGNQSTTSSKVKGEIDDENLVAELKKAGISTTGWLY